jgi:dolichyl-phosphate beta-glucosyltransferase
MTPIALSIVIPAYNEGARIGRTLDSLRAYLPGLGLAWQIVVADDGSMDDTAAVVERAAADDPRIVLQREPHRGKGGTVRAGMLAARGELRLMCDADMSMPVHELPRFLELVPSRYDIVIGSREGAGARRIGEPAHRHGMGRMFNGLVRRMAVPGIQDTQCGFKIFTRAAAEAVFPRVTIEGWAFDIEVLVIARRLGFSIHELPIEWHYRAQSQVSPLRDSLLMAWDVLKIRANAAKGRYDASEDRRQASPGGHGPANRPGR